MPKIKTIDINQKAVKAFQKKIRAHRDELKVHLDHFNDMIQDLEKDRRNINNAIVTLDQALSACKSASEYARRKPQPDFWRKSP